MTPLKIIFSGLEIDPADLSDRVHYGVIPLEWHRYRFPSETPVTQVNRWLAENIEGRWAIYMTFFHENREITIAFERAYDGSMFVLADGPRRCAEALS